MKEEEETGKDNNCVFTIEMGRTPSVVEMEIMGCKLTNTIVDGGLGVNVLPEETWKAIGKPTLWPPTFQLVGANQHGIKPIGTLMGEKVVSKKILPRLCSNCPVEEVVQCIIGERMSNLNKS